MLNYLPVLCFIDSSRSEKAVIRGLSVTTQNTHIHAHRGTPGQSVSCPKGGFEEDSYKWRGRPRQSAGITKCYRERDNAVRL